MGRVWVGDRGQVEGSRRAYAASCVPTGVAEVTGLYLGGRGS